MRITKRQLIFGLIGFLSLFLSFGAKAFLPDALTYWLMLFSWSLIVVVPVAIIGILSVLLYLVGLLRGLKQHCQQVDCVFVLVGFLLSVAVNYTLLYWEDVRRDKAGLLFASALADYYKTFGHYPESLNELSADLQSTLPYPFSYRQFSYVCIDKNNTYHLSTSWWFEHWVWNQKTEQFDYFNW